MRLLLLAAIAAVTRVSASLRVEVYGNSVSRGTPRCNTTLPNDGATLQLRTFCPSLLGTPASSVSLRITGTLTAAQSGSKWYRFGIRATKSSWTRLWVDDHRLVDAWGDAAATATADLAMPVTPSLLPNVTLSPSRILPR